MKCLYYKKESDYIQCQLCPHMCQLKAGAYGRCLSRQNINGQMVNHNYGKITAIAMDPIEKKPLKKFYPSEKVLSIGFFGCNFRCKNCQNYHISMSKSEQKLLSVDGLVDLVLSSDCLGIAFTYNEPLINYEYILESSKALKARSDKKVILVTNGFINQEPLKALLPYIDAMNIDLKSFENSFYKTICEGSLDPVLKTIETASKECHVEVTTLVIPTLNDTIEEIESLAKFISNIDDKIPLHLTAYYPRYKLNLPATQASILYKMQAVCSKYLIDVFVGNI